MNQCCLDAAALGLHFCCLLITKIKIIIQLLFCITFFLKSQYVNARLRQWLQEAEVAQAQLDAFLLQINQLNQIVNKSKSKYVSPSTFSSCLVWHRFCDLIVLMPFSRKKCYKFETDKGKILGRFLQLLQNEYILWKETTISL